MISWIEEWVDTKFSIFQEDAEQLLLSPSTLQAYAEPPPDVTTSLQAHLDGLVAESSRQGELQAHITAALQDKALCQHLRVELNRRMQALGFSTAQISKINHQQIEKVRYICEAKQRLRMEHAVRTKPAQEPRFVFGVVTALGYKGRPGEMANLCLPESTTWAAFLRVLTEATATWQATENGFPKGYTIDDGRWQYLIVQPRPDKFHSLDNEKDYLRLKRVLKEGKTVTVWHVRICFAMVSWTSRERQANTKCHLGDHSEAGHRAEREARSFSS